MKKLVLSLALVASLIGFSQEKIEDQDDLRKNEIKLNGLLLVLGAFEVEYEYLLSEESGIGASLLVPIDPDISEDLNFYLSPYYRFYFGNKYAQGFFLEGFAMLDSYNDYTYYYGMPREKKTFTDFALGIGLGGKWVTKKGLLGQINFGVGRNLFNSNGNDFEIIGKFGITLGYRF